MDVAEARLGEVGYLGVSLEEVAKAVGVSKPALYYHFPGGKEQLFVEISHRALGRTREGLERAIGSAERGAGKLEAISRWILAETGRGMPMGELRHVANFVGEEHRAGLAEGFYGSLYGPIRRTIAAAVESGEFRENDPDFLTWAFLGLVLGMVDVQRAPSNGPASPAAHGRGEGIAFQMTELFLDGARL